MSVSKRNKIRLSIACLAAFAIIAGGWTDASAVAQEFRVYTKVYRLTRNANAKPEIIARSLSLFQAGLVYDLVLPAGEVVVFDAGNRRFTLLNTLHKLVTVVSFDELERMLRKSRTETQRFLNQLNNANDRKAITSLRFQLNPRFKEKVDLKNKQLTLSSSSLGYTVKCASPQVPEAVDTYLRYTDWTARLNHILHPQALLPGPRVALDSRLRERKWLPVAVQLRAEPGTPLLRAEHRFAWKLSSQDRSLIGGWKKMLGDPQTRRVKFREYQRVLLKTEVTER